MSIKFGVCSQHYSLKVLSITRNPTQNKRESVIIICVQVYVLMTKSIDKLLNINQLSTLGLNLFEERVLKLKFSSSPHPVFGLQNWCCQFWLPKPQTLQFNFWVKLAWLFLAKLVDCGSISICLYCVINGQGIDISDKILKFTRNNISHL